MDCLQHSQASATTTWFPALGDQQHGFPYLSGVGRLIIKDAIMLAAAVVTLAHAARETLRRQMFGGA